jgi:hypothetical protein
MSRQNLERGSELGSDLVLLQAGTGSKGRVITSEIHWVSNMLPRDHGSQSRPALGVVDRCQTQTMTDGEEAWHWQQ